MTSARSLAEVLNCLVLSSNEKLARSNHGAVKKMSQEKYSQELSRQVTLIYEFNNLFQ